MRLGQLARKLALRPAEMIEFLAANNILIKEGSNTKLEEGHLSLLLQRFAPDMQKDLTSESDIQEEPTLESEIVSDESEASLEKIMETELSHEGIEVAEEQKAEVIKAPKVELSGLKVLGKIELPEVKKKPVEDSLEIEPVVEVPKNSNEERRSPNIRKHQGSQRSPRNKNSIALERDREAVAANEKREAEAKLQKERRTQNYLKKVKSPQPTKAAKLVNEHTMEMSAAELAESPKTWWGRFIKWFTT